MIYGMKKLVVSIIAAVMVLLAYEPSFAANFPLEIMNIKPAGTDGMTTRNRIFRAYPGLEYNIRPAVLGGMYPYTFAFAANQPAWLTINPDSGVISGIAPSSGTYNNITIQVTDLEGNTTTATWSITVTTSNFYFLDAVNGNDSTGDGSLANPWQTMAKVYNRTFDGSQTNWIVYYRAGTYSLYANSSQTYNGVSYPYLPINDNYPMIWLAYPHETVTIDMNHGSLRYSETSAQTHAWFDGLIFTNMSLWGFKPFGNSTYDTIRRSEFKNLAGPDTVNNNYGFIEVGSMCPWTGDPSTSYIGGLYHVIQDNKFHDYTDATAVGSIYCWRKLLIEDNEFYNASDVLGSRFALAIGIKANTDRTTIRHNYVHFSSDTGSLFLNDFTGPAVGVRDMEVCFNRFLAVSDTNKAVMLNQHMEQFRTYFYRNTVRGAVWLKQLDLCTTSCGAMQTSYNVSGYPQSTCTAVYSSESWMCSGNGPFYINDNIIINADNTWPRNSDNINRQGGWGSNPANEYHPSNNLVGTSANNIIDANGNFTPNYASKYSGRNGHWIPTMKTKP